MPNFNEAIPTNNAMKIITDILAGKAKVEFTHTVASSKDYSKLTDEQLASLTTIDEVKQDVQIKEVNILNSDTVVIPLRFDNTKVLEDYQIFTIGVYARELDGSEVLYSIMTAKTPQLQPAYDGNSPTTFKINAETIVGKAANVEVIVNPMDNVTLDRLNSKLTEYVKITDFDKLIAEKIPDTLADITKDEHVTGVWNFDHLQIGGKELSLGGDSGSLVLTDSDATISGTYNFTTTPTINSVDVATVDDVAKKADDDNVIHRSADTGMATDPTAFNYGDLKVGTNPVSGEVDISQADYTALGSNFEPNVTYFIPES